LELQNKQKEGLKMSSIRVKTTYQTMGDYGSMDQHELMCIHNNSCDIVTFYSDGECLFSVEDTESNNLWDALQRLWLPYKTEWFGDLEDNVEYMSKEDLEKIK